MRLDRIRFAVAPADEREDPDDDSSVVAGELQVLILCTPWDGDGEIELTARGAGLGMGPFDLLIPENRLDASEAPRAVPVARCTCSIYGCAMTDAVIERGDGVVRWGWEHQAPFARPLTFDAEEYDAEVARIGSDRSWERPEDTAARRVFELVDPERLAASGMRISFAAPRWDEPERFQVCLSLRDPDPFQIFVEVDWRGDPERTARAVRELLDGPIPEWPARFMPNAAAGAQRPRIAGPGWSRR